MDFAKDLTASEEICVIVNSSVKQPVLTYSRCFFFTREASTCLFFSANFVLCFCVPYFQPSSMNNVKHMASRIIRLQILRIILKSFFLDGNVDIKIIC